MSHGKSIISDLAVLEYYSYRFDKRRPFWAFASDNGLHSRQLYSHLSKHRFGRWIDYGVALETGWLTEEGKEELARLRGLQKAPPVPLGGDPSQDLGSHGIP